jgi:hypothetical protein
MSAALDISPPSQLIEPEAVSALPELLPLTADRKLLCLKVLVETGGNISHAAQLLGTTRQNIHRWVQTDPVFAELFHDAIEAGTDNLEERAYYRASETSDRLMEFLLRARRPERYRDNPRGEADLDLDVSALASLLRAVCERARQLQVDQAGQLDHVGQVAAIGDGHSESSAVIDVVPMGQVDQAAQSGSLSASGASGSGQPSSPPTIATATDSNPQPRPANKRRYHT